MKKIILETLIESTINYMDFLNSKLFSLKIVKGINQLI